MAEDNSQQSGQQATTSDVVAGKGGQQTQGSGSGQATDATAVKANTPAVEQTTVATPVEAKPAPLEGAEPSPIPNEPVVDRNKSPEKYMEEAESKYIIPVVVRDKFPDLVKLIYETESMDQEEREYWMQIMPIMTEEQIVKFRNILVNEREQLAKLDQEYKTEMSKIQKKPAPKLDEVKMKAKMAKIKKKEEAAEVEEEAEGEDLLKQLEDL